MHALTAAAAAGEPLILLRRVQALGDEVAVAVAGLGGDAAAVGRYAVGFLRVEAAELYRRFRSVVGVDVHIVHRGGGYGEVAKIFGFGILKAARGCGAVGRQAVEGGGGDARRLVGRVDKLVAVADGHLVARGVVDVVPVVTVGVGAFGQLAVVAVGGLLTEVDVNALLECEVILGAGEALYFLHLHGIDVEHPLHSVEREGDAAVFVGEDRVGNADIAVVAVVAVFAQAGAGGLIGGRPAVLALEDVFAHAHIVGSAAAERREAVGLLRVEIAEGHEVVVLEVFRKDIVVGSRFHC